MTFLNSKIQLITREKYKLNLESSKSNQATFETRSYGPKVCNALLYHMKPSYDLNSFKAISKCWNGNHCTCRTCKHATSRH